MSTIQFIELMDGARKCIQDYCELKKGEEVLIVGDSYSSDPWVIDALAIAVSEVGANPTKMILPKPKSWEAAWPSLPLAAILASDVTIRLPGRAFGHSGLRDKTTEKKVFAIKGNISKREHLASDFGRFPYKLLITIAEEGNKRVKGKQVYRITDPLGTDLTVEVDADKGVRGFAANIRKLGEKRPAYLDWPGATCGVWPVSGGKTNGVIISRATHFSTMPEMKLTVKDGLVTKIQGGGLFGEMWREALEEYKDKEFGFHPGPGVNWVEEVMWGLHPKASLERPESPDLPFLHWASRSSRVIHIAMGGGYGSHHHRDVELDDFTLTVDGETLIDKGRLLVLDDSKVKEVAKEFGDPEELLKVL